MANGDVFAQALIYPVAGDALTSLLGSVVYQTEVTCTYAEDGHLVPIRFQPAGCYQAAHWDWQPQS